MRRRSKIALTIGAIVLAVLLLLQTPLLERLRGHAWSVWLSTVARVFALGRLSSDATVDKRLQELLLENLRLKAQLQEYGQLKEQVASPAFESFRVIPAEIVVRPLDAFRSQMIINQGTADGVTLNAPVVVYGSSLVGFVTELHEQSAVIQLLLHPSTNFAAEVVNEMRPEGLLVGRHYTSLVLTRVPLDAELASDQTVVTPAREGVPAGLVVGMIGSITRQENEAFQEAQLKLPYDPDQLRAVNVLVLP